MWALYGFHADMLTSPAMIRLFHDLIDRLQFEPNSRVRALQADDEHMFGWGPLLESQAAIVESVRRLEVSIMVALGAKEQDLVLEPYEGRPVAQLENVLSGGRRKNVAQPESLADVQGFLGLM